MHVVDHLRRWNDQNENTTLGRALFAKVMNNNVIHSNLGQPTGENGRLSDMKFNIKACWTLRMPGILKVH